MFKEEFASIFNCYRQHISSDRIWNRFKEARYKIDTIELKIDCYRISQGSRDLKQISLEIGEKTMYYIKDGIYKGQLSLNFSTMNVHSYDGQQVFRFSKNKRFVDIVVNNQLLFQKCLSKKCIQSTFHDEFYVEKTIAYGKQAIIFQAMKKETNERFAIKAFSKQFILQQEKGKDVLMNEIKALRKLHQDNIIHLHEVYETLNSIYLVIDLVEGGQLQRTAEDIISKECLQLFMLKLIRALQYMHQKKCIHRNLSPENILLKNKENILDFVIIGFGQVSFIGVQPLFKTVGTLGYIAPELLNQDMQCEQFNDKSDIFSVGAILYMLITGYGPFGEQNYVSMRKRNKYCMMNFESESILNQSKLLQNLLKMMLRMSPKNRPNVAQCLQHQYLNQIIESPIIQSNNYIQSEELQQISENDTMSNQESTDQFHQFKEHFGENQNEKQQFKGKQDQKLSKFIIFCHQMTNLKQQQCQTKIKLVENQYMRITARHSQSYQTQVYNQQQTEIKHKNYKKVDIDEKSHSINQ